MHRAHGCLLEQQRAAAHEPPQRVGRAASPSMVVHTHALTVPSTELVSRRSPLGCMAMLHTTLACAWKHSTCNTENVSGCVCLCKELARQGRAAGRVRRRRRREHSPGILLGCVLNPAVLGGQLAAHCARVCCSMHASRGAPQRPNAPPTCCASTSSQ